MFILLFAQNIAQAADYFTPFYSVLYRPDIEKIEKYLGITPASDESMDARLFEVENTAKVKFNYLVPSGDVPLRISELSQNLFGSFTPPNESRTKAAIAATQSKSKSHKMRLPGFQWAHSLPQYGLPAPMPGTGTTWGTPQPFISQPVFVNGQSAGLLNTLPGGGYSYFGH